ncbi:MAG: hypothetical protein JST19_22930 [Bacteroidetes bacterium]|nr:hypothetical protein [Bacteroidota bacterium]
MGIYFDSNISDNRGNTKPLMVNFSTTPAVRHIGTLTTGLFIFSRIITQPGIIVVKAQVRRYSGYQPGKVGKHKQRNDSQDIEGYTTFFLFP